MNNEDIDVIKQVLEVADTCLKGLEHVKTRLNEGYFEETKVLFYDSLNAFYRIQESIQPFLEDLTENNLTSLGSSLTQAFELAVSAYEQEDRAKVKEIMQFTLLPEYKRWREELNRYLHPHLVS